MKRSEHTFQFSAQQIRDAAASEADYHEARVLHWRERLERALERVEETIGAKVVRHATTDGEQVNVVVDHGDADAWQEYQLAFGKLRTHGKAAARFRTDERVYGSQTAPVGAVTRTYDLDVDDVHHFRLGGEPREE